VIRFLLIFAILSVVAAPQQTSQPGRDAKGKPAPAPKPPPPDQPAPLFNGQLGVRSSQKTKESATMGFNGIDPSGKVERKMLAANPTARDVAQIQNMSALRPGPAELKAFLKAGGLKAK
jgi:hypothetical protein